MEETNPTDENLAELFGNHRTLRAVIESVLERRLGRCRLHGRSATSARLDLGCYAILGGDASSEEAEALVREIEAPRELLVADEQPWRDLLYAVFGERLEDRTMRTFASDAVEPERLRELRAFLPAGFVVEPFTAATARQLEATIVPHALQVFDDAAHFARDGIGFAAFDGGRVACAATSYAISSTRVEIAIATRQEYRGRGLARAVAAAMLLGCLERGLRPEWSAANPVSKHLALSLGYRPAALCDILFLSEEGAP